MSDHFLEAWDQWEAMGADPGEFQGGSGYHYSAADDKFYHTCKEYKEILSETDKTVLYLFADDSTLWIPRKIIKKSIKKNHIWIHTETLCKIRKNVF